MSRPELRNPASSNGIDTGSVYEKSFEEVSLPFTLRQKDHLEGDELVEGISNQLSQLGDYRVSSVPLRDDEKFEVNAVRNHPSIGEFSYISFEADVNGEYSHLRLEIGASGPEMYASVERDLKKLERGLDDYFGEENMGEKYDLAPAD